MQCPLWDSTISNLATGCPERHSDIGRKIRGQKLRATFGAGTKVFRD